MAKSGFAKDQLKSFINRIERLSEEREALSADIREVYSEAKGTGFDTKIMRQVIRMRKLDKADFQEQEAMLDLYLTAMDMRDAPLLDYGDRGMALRPAAPEIVKALEESEIPARSTVDADHVDAGPEEIMETQVSSSAVVSSAADTFTSEPLPEIPTFLDRRPHELATASNLR